MTENLTELAFYRTTERYKKYNKQFSKRVDAFTKDSEGMLKYVKRLARHVDAMQGLFHRYGDFLDTQRKDFNDLTNQLNPNLEEDYDFDLLSLITNVAGNNRVLANELNQTFKALGINYLKDIYNYPKKTYEDIPGIGEVKMQKFINFLAYKVPDMHKEHMKDLFESPLLRSIRILKPARRKLNDLERSSKILTENIKHYSDLEVNEITHKAS